MILNPQSPKEAFEYVQMMFDQSDYFSLLFLDLSFDDLDYVIDLKQVVDAIESVSQVSPNLELIIDLKDTEDFITYNTYDGNITIEVSKSHTGNFEIEAVLQDN